MKEVESYHFEMEAHFRRGMGGLSLDLPFSFTGEVQSPDRVRGTVSMQLLGMSLEFQTITIGSTSYQQDPLTGEWQVREGQQAPLQEPQDFLEEDVSAIQGLTVMGVETIDNVQTYRLKGTVPQQEAGEEFKSDMEVEYWIGVEDKLVRRVTARGEMEFMGEEGLPGQPTGGTMVMDLTLDLSRFGEPVTIKAPEVTYTPTPETPLLGPAPDLQITLYQGQEQLGGTETSLRAVLAQGRPVVLNLWTSGCGPCLTEMQYLQSLQYQYSNEVLVLGVDVGPFLDIGSWQESQTLLKEMGITYPAGVSTDPALALEYRVSSFPVTYFITPQGEMVASRQGTLRQEEVQELLEGLLANR